MKSTAIILIRDADGKLERVPFAAERMIVGRTAEAGVRIDHGLVSRRHAELWRDAAGRHHVRDLKSRNGTFVNGQRVTDRQLEEDDRIGIGDRVLMISSPLEMGAGDDARPSEPARQSTRLVLTGEDAGRLSTLKDHEPPRIEVSHLMTLNAFARSLLETAQASDRAKALCTLMVGPQFRAHWAVTLRMRTGGEELPPELLCEAYATRSMREPHLSRGVMRKVRETGEAVLASNVGLPANQEGNAQISIALEVMAMAAVACPMARGPDTLDVLYVMLPPGLGSAEWLALVNLAVQQHQQAEGAWTARHQAQAVAVMERELDRAQRIQMRLVPKDPRFEGLDLAIGFVPCKWVGGDYVDALQMADGRTLLAVADVCGKGLGAALVASSVHTMVHAGVLSGLSLLELMSNLNRYLCRTLPAETFVTMVAVALDPATGQMEMVNAGHPSILLIAPGHAARQVQRDTNLPLGIEEEAMHLHRLDLAAHELLALYTDGLSELSTSDTQMLGIEGLATELAAAYGSEQTTAARAADALTRRLDALQGSRAPADDRTFLLARRRGEP